MMMLLRKYVKNINIKLRRNKVLSFFAYKLIGDYMFTRKIDVRMKVLLLLFSFLLTLVVVRIFYVQMFEYDKLFSLANDLWSRDLPIEADRGLILDRNGVVLADNLTTTSLVLIPNQIKNKKEVAEKISKILNSLFILFLFY